MELWIWLCGLLLTVAAVGASSGTLGGISRTKRYLTYSALA